MGIAESVVSSSMTAFETDRQEMVCNLQAAGFQAGGSDEGAGNMIGEQATT